VDDKKQSRRRFLSSLLEAGISIPKGWAKDKLSAVSSIPAEAKRKTNVSPPGSLSHEHLNSTCNGCQKCISVCPKKVLKPSTKEYDMAGIMQPYMDFSSGYCDYECNLCSEICPTGAISKITLEQKQDIQIGIAVVTNELCKANLEGECNICQAECPASAIKLKENYNMPMVEIDGVKRYPKYPIIEDILCIGCGLCEFLCPSTPAKAIHIEGFKEHK